MRPIAGNYAATIFALGVLGTGLLATPSSPAQQCTPLLKPVSGLGLARQPKEAKAFYATTVLATVVGVLLNFAPVNPIKALYWCAVINGIVAVPAMALMMLTGNSKIMVEFAIGGWLTGLGWVATAIMAAAAVAMGITYLMYISNKSRSGALRLTSSRGPSPRPIRKRAPLTVVCGR